MTCFDQAQFIHFIRAGYSICLFQQHGGGGADERRREIERRDAELARLLQEEEELRHRRRSAHKSSRHPRQASDVAQPTTSLVTTPFIFSDHSRFFFSNHHQ
jgi:hypothetical protein